MVSLGAGFTELVAVEGAGLEWFGAPGTLTAILKDHLWFYVGDLVALSKPANGSLLNHY